MKIDLPLLKKLCETPGAPGFEKLVRDLVISELKDKVDGLETDNMGNLVSIKRGKKNPENRRVMLAAHMDEIGFIVKHIDDKGFIRFHTLGGFDPKTLTAQRVLIHGKKDVMGVMGTKPIHLMKSEEKTKPVEIDDFFIDTGMSKKQLEATISVGDPITRERVLEEMGDCINCKSLDNRISVYILVEVMKHLKNNNIDVYGVFTVQEEVGIRGAQVAAHTINPDYGIGIDTTIAFDLPGAQPHETVTSLGDGVAIKIMDASAICDPRMVQFLKETADRSKIKWQPELLTAGGTDTAGIQRTGKSGSIAGAVSIPTRHLHQVIEMVHKKDVSAGIDLLLAALQNVQSYNWEH